RRTGQGLRCHRPNENSKTSVSASQPRPTARSGAAPRTSSQGSARYATATMSADSSRPLRTRPADGPSIGTRTASRRRPLRMASSRMASQIARAFRAISWRTVMGAADRLDGNSCERGKAELSPIDAGTDTGDSLEHPAERGAVLVADLPADLVDRERRLLEQ